ncbi:MAG: extracellular solute-binding protein [Paracoccaceae bacterium]
MSVTRRRLLGGAAALSAAGVLGARVRPAYAGVTPGKPFDGQEVNVLSVQATQFAAHEKRVAEFQELTGIKVNYVYVPFVALRERLTAEMVGASDDFDIITAMDVWIPPLVDTYLAPIDDMVADRGIDLSRYPDPFLNAGKFPGGLYGLPVRCHVQLMWYRKDLFDKAGLAPPETWEDVSTSGRAIMDQNPGVDGITIPYSQKDGQNLMVWYNFLWGSGGDLFDAEMTPIFNSEAGVKATADFTKYILEDKITPAGAASFNEADSTTHFFQGKAAMVPVWWHVYNRLTKPDTSVTKEQVGFKVLPHYEGKGATTYTNAWIYGINAKAKAPDAAKEFLDFICQPEIEKAILIDPEESDVVCVHWQNLRDEEVNARFDGMHALAAKTLETTTNSIPNIPEFLPIVDVLGAAVSDVVTGAATIQDALDNAQSQSARIMRRG